MDVQAATQMMTRVARIIAMRRSSRAVRWPTRCAPVMSFACWSLGIGATAAMPHAYRIILYQGLAHVQEADVVVLKGRAGAVITIVDTGTLVQQPDRQQIPANGALVEVSDIDDVAGAEVHPPAHAVAHGVWPEQRDHEVRARVHPPASQRRTEAGGSAGNLHCLGHVAQPADPEGAVDHETSQRAHSGGGTQLGNIVQRAHYLAQVGEEVVSAGTKRAREATILIGDRKDERLIEARVETIGEAVRAFPGIVRLQRRDLSRRERRPDARGLGCTVA